MKKMEILIVVACLTLGIFLIFIKDGGLVTADNDHNQAIEDSRATVKNAIERDDDNWSDEELKALSIAKIQGKEERLTRTAQKEAAYERDRHKKGATLFNHQDQNEVVWTGKLESISKIKQGHPFTCVSIDGELVCATIAEADELKIGDQVEVRRNTDGTFYTLATQT